MKKIINLFLVLFAGLILVSLGTPEVFAEENDFEFNITVVKGETIDKLHPLSGDFGTQISFNADGLEVDEFEFAYHILNGEIIETSSYDVLASKSTNLIVVLERLGEPVTTYIDTNGELLGAFISSEDQPASKPTKPGFDFQDYVQVEDTEKPVFVAKYSRLEDKPILVTVNSGSKDPEDVTYNDVVTLTPADAVNFKYWADMDGQIISTKPNYAFTALQDVEIQAVTDGEVNTNPVIYLSNVTGITPNAKSFLGYIEGDFVEYGVLASNKEEVLTLDTLDVTVIPSQALNPLTNEFLRSIPETEDLKSFRAYAKLADGGVVYSENNFFMSKGSGGDEFTETFDNFGPTSYSDGTYNGVASSQWTYVHMRDQDTFEIEGGGAILRRSDEPSSISVELINGIDTFSFDYRKAYTGNTTRNYKVEVSNNGVTDTYELDTTDFGDGADETVFEFIYSGSPLNGLVTIKIYASGPAGNQQLTIDNFEWTEYTQEDVNTKLHLIKFVNNEEIFETIVRHKEPLKMPLNPVKTGYKFVGWTDETENVIDAGMLISDDMTLTAKFEVEIYTLTFDSNGGSVVAPLTQAYGSELVLPVPTKEGYTFAGWSPVLPETMPAGNQTYTATWTANDYTITFDVDGGSVVAPLTQAYGSELVLPVPTKDGFNFVGWFTDVDKTIPFEETTMPLGNTTLYALWQDASLTSIVTFEVNGGSEIAPVVVNNGEAVVKPIDPTKEGYTFDGWFSDVALEVAYDFEALISTDLTLYAKWEHNVYSISFDPNGGSGSIQVKSAVHGNTLVETERPTQPTQDGFNFVGWFDTNATSGGNKWTNETVFTSVKTYYARWESLITKETFTENFDGATVLPSGSNYGDATFTGINNITWTVVHGQQVGTHSISGAGILLRRASDGLLSTTLSGGLSSLSIDFRKGYTGGTTRNVEIIINGIVYDFLVNSSSGTDVTVFKFSKDNLDLEGNVSISIKLKGTSTSNAHLVIDNFQWQNNPQ